MTTIATDGKSIASDGQVTDNSIIEDLNRKKVHKLPDGRALGFAGCLISCEMFLEWIKDTTQQPPEGSDEFEAVVIDGSDKVTVYNHRYSPLVMPTPYCTGTGKQVALGAMMAGATPKQAVKLATKVDIYSGGTVREIKAKPSA